MTYIRLDTLETVDSSGGGILYGATLNSTLVRTPALFSVAAPGRVPYLRISAKWAVRLVPNTPLNTRAAQLAFLSARDGMACFYCGSDLDLDSCTVEHIVAVAHGGPDHADNLCLACRPCNAAAGALPAASKVKLAIASRVGTIALKMFNEKTKTRKGLNK